MSYKYEQWKKGQEIPLTSGIIAIDNNSRHYLLSRDYRDSKYILQHGEVVIPTDRKDFKEVVRFIIQNGFEILVFEKHMIAADYYYKKLAGVL